MTEPLQHARVISLCRNTSEASSMELVSEQLRHLGIDENSDYGHAISRTASHLDGVQSDITTLWHITNKILDPLSKENSVAYFNAKKFQFFQIAKILDILQNPFHKTYQSLSSGSGAQGHYSLFDNVTALAFAVHFCSNCRFFIQGRDCEM